jgi:hypothetical protein
VSTAKKRAPAKKSAPRKKSRKSETPGWLRWWPVALGVVLAPFAVRAVDILALTGPWEARALVPWTFLFQGHSLHLPQGWSDNLAAAVMYAQFPVYGLLAMLLARRLHWMTTLALLIALHVAAYVTLFLWTSS